MAGLRLLLGARRLGRRGGRRLGRLLGRGLRLGGRGVATRGRGVAVTDDGEVGADGDGVVLLGEDLLEGARHGGGDLGVDLVGRDLEQWLVDLDAVTDVLQPAGDGPLGD